MARFYRWIALILVLSSSLVTRAATDGVTDHAIEIGASGALSGPVGPFISAMRDGYLAYFKKVNADGGVFGRKINYTVLDDRYDPQQARQNAENLINDKKVFALVGGNGAAGISAMLPVLEKAEVPLVFPFAGSNFLYSPVKRNVFNLRPSFDREVRELVKRLLKGRKNPKVAIFYQDDVFGTSGRDGAIAAISELGERVVRTASHSRSETSFDKAIDDLKKSGAEIVILSTNPGPAATFMLGSAKRGFSPVFGGISSISIPMIVDAMGTTPYKAYFSNPMPLLSTSEYPIVNDFQKELPDLKSAPLRQVAFDGFVTAKVFTEALKRAGKDLTRDKLRESLENLVGLSIGGMELTNKPKTHQAFETVYVYKIENGKIQRDE